MGVGPDEGDGGAPRYEISFLWHLAVWGAIHPMAYFLQWFNENGYDLMAMVDAWHANAASSGLVWDLTIAAVALTVWVIWESRAAAGLWIGLFGDSGDLLYRGELWLPLYLFLRMGAALIAKPERVCYDAPKLKGEGHGSFYLSRWAVACRGCPRGRDCRAGGHAVLLLFHGHADPAFPAVRRGAWRAPTIWCAMR